VENLTEQSEGIASA